MHFFPEKKVMTFLVIILKTQVFTITTNAQNTTNISRGQVPPPTPACGRP